MKLHYKIILIALLFTFSLKSQENPLPENFNMKTFYEYNEIASWLCFYDKVAWVTSDSVMTESPEDMEKLGPEWFCYQDEKGQWHAFYGAYDIEKDNYNIVFQYKIDTLNYTVSRSKEEMDTSKINPLARAVYKGVKYIKEKELFYFNWNWYVRYNEKNQIEYYAFPAFQRDGKAIYGVEIFLLYDEKGIDLIEGKLLEEKEIRYFMPNTEKSIQIQYLERDMPTLGAVFYVLYYNHYFKDIRIECKEMISSYIITENHSSWIHILKEDIPIEEGPIEEIKENEAPSKKKKKKRKKSKK